MLVVKVELHSATTGEISELGRMYIANDGTGTPKRGNYQAAVCKKGSFAVPFPINPKASTAKRASRFARVEDYARESLPIWRLVMRALAGAFPEERSPKVALPPMPKPKTLMGVIDAAAERFAWRASPDTRAELLPGERIDFKGRPPSPCGCTTGCKAWECTNL